MSYHEWSTSFWEFGYFVSFFLGGFYFRQQKIKGFYSKLTPIRFHFFRRILVLTFGNQVFPCCGRTVSGLLLGLFTIEATWIFGASNSNWITKNCTKKRHYLSQWRFFFVKEKPFLSFKVPWWPVGDQNLCVQHRLFQGVMGMGGGQGINSCW